MGAYDLAINIGPLRADVGALELNSNISDTSIGASTVGGMGATVPVTSTVKITRRIRVAVTAKATQNNANVTNNLKLLSFAVELPTGKN